MIIEENIWWFSVNRMLPGFPSISMFQAIFWKYVKWKSFLLTEEVHSVLQFENYYIEISHLFWIGIFFMVFVFLRGLEMKK